MAATSGFDNRKYQRAPFKRPVRFKAANVEIYAGHLAQDISQGGIRICSNEFVAVGSRVIIQFQLDSQRKLFDLEARVIWTKELPYSGDFQLGLEFTVGASFEKMQIAEFAVKR